MRHQRKPTAELTNLTARIRTEFADVLTWSQQEYNIFGEVEALLFLHEMLVPDVASRNYRDAWTLVSGFSAFDDPTQLQHCLNLRSRLRYVKTATAWRYWVKWYFREKLLRHDLRLYRTAPSVTEADDRRFERVPVGVFADSDRIAVYGQMLVPAQSAILTPELAGSGKKMIEPGTYTFRIGDVNVEVVINAGLINSAERHTKQAVDAISAPRERGKPAAISVDLDTLLKTAQRMDQHEIEIGLTADQRGNWADRIDILFFTLHDKGIIREKQCQFRIDGLFHLVGLLGIGKSSLIAVLTYHLATVEDKHITVVFGTVVETIRFAAWLRKLGVAAAPALGRNRADHAQKYGLANTAEFASSRIIQPESPDEPAFRWMAVPCALRGAASTTIPIGQEPCYSLTDQAGERYDCPLIAVCPVHTLYRDLAASAVWTVNPQSFLYSAIPDPAHPENRIRLLEAIYDRSDLVIIDEADRVQVVWDQIFAPTRPLAGSDDSLLDKLHNTLAQKSTGSYGRRQATNARFDRLVTQDGQAHQLATKVYRLILRHPKLAEWIKGSQITNESLFYHLTEEIIKKLPERLSQNARETVRKALSKEFSAFWRNPLRRETGLLADWLTQFLLPGAETPENRHMRLLRKWLANHMQRTAESTAVRQLGRKVQFSILLSAMIKRANDLQFQQRYAPELFDGLKSKQPDLPDDVAALTLDPPLGKMLGIRLNGHDAINRVPGVFHYLRYLGIGRWLLLNLPQLHTHEGRPGPHVLLTSATSWMPGSAQFHLAIEPHGVLMAKRTTADIRMMSRPVHIETQTGQKMLNISGNHKYRQQNMRQIVHDLIDSGHFEGELNHWRTRYNQRRAILLVVNSYEQAEWVRDALQQHPAWESRAIRLIRDDDESQSEGTIRAREAENFGQHDADVLIAPLLTIQRGFNILDDLDSALLGSVYFLVRPYPPPDDLSTQILGMNAWVLRQLEPDLRTLRSNLYPERGTHAAIKFRRRAYREWSTRITHVRYGLKQLTADMYHEFACDLFVTLWQTIGRLLRGGRPARVFFVDGAFSPADSSRNVLRDIYAHLAALRLSESAWTRYLATQLYAPAYDAFHNGYESKELL